MGTIKIGRVRPVYRGDYNIETNYVVLDRVRYNGSVWECVADAPAGTSPQDNAWTFWVEIGAKGDKGDQGVQGPQGEKGEQGIQGIQGPEGEKGDKGDKGDTGDTGPTGPKGEKGDQGIQGPQGVQGPVGPQGEQGAKGDTGDPGEDGVSGIIESVTAEVGDTVGTPAVSVQLGGTTLLRTIHLSFSNLKGEKGDKGDTGAQGEKGDKGDTGEQGPKGETGAQGPQGPQGVQGLPGTTTWAGITDKPTSFTPAVHVHTVDDVTSLQDLLDQKQPVGNYAASEHTHEISDVTGLQSALDGKQPTGSYLTTDIAASTYLGISAKAVSAGTADSATKAAQDSDGNAINTTYLKIEIAATSYVGVAEQTFTTEQQAQARANIGAIALEDVPQDDTAQSILLAFQQFNTENGIQ